MFAKNAIAEFHYLVSITRKTANRRSTTNIGLLHNLIVVIKFCRRHPRYFLHEKITVTFRRQSISLCAGIIFIG